jgi:small subunit ribosomal protein S21
MRAETPAVGCGCGRWLARFLEGIDMIEIRIRKGEDIQRGLRRLKKVLGREKLFDELRKRRHYQKPSKVRREKSKVAAFNAMLRQRYADI